MIATAVSIQDSLNHLFSEALPGLCETCTHSAACTYRIRTSKIVLQCEMFEVEQVNFIHINRKVSGYEESEVDSHKGLCSNCLNKSNCNLPKASSGVWHCEEYV